MQEATYYENSMQLSGRRRNRIDFIIKRVREQMSDMKKNPHILVYKYIDDFDDLYRVCDLEHRNQQQPNTYIYMYIFDNIEVEFEVQEEEEEENENSGMSKNDENNINVEYKLDEVRDEFHSIKIYFKLFMLQANKNDRRS